MLSEVDVLVLAALARRVALESGRPARLDRLRHDLRRALPPQVVEEAVRRLERAGEVFACGDGWRLRSVRVHVEATEAFASTVRLRLVEPAATP